MSKDVLYVGSGNSALLSSQYDLSNLIVCCVNNAHLLFDSFDYWIRPGDFPIENYPKIKNYKQGISYSEYSKQIRIISERLNWNVASVEHHAGYTTFFNGLYWIMGELSPKNIYTIGFDHDYNKEKLKKWYEKGNPAPNNRYNGLDIQKEFKEFENDSFYGISTPDPMRLGEQHLKEKFEIAKETAKQLNINLWNLSDVRGINSFNKINKPI
jgi:hypothetical protein